MPPIQALLPFLARSLLCIAFEASLHISGLLVCLKLRIEKVEYVKQEIANRPITIEYVHAKALVQEPLLHAGLVQRLMGERRRARQYAMELFSQPRGIYGTNEGSEYEQQRGESLKQYAERLKSLLRSKASGRDSIFLSA